MVTVHGFLSRAGRARHLGLIALAMLIEWGHAEISTLVLRRWDLFFTVKTYKQQAFLCDVFASTLGGTLASVCRN